MPSRKSPYCGDKPCKAGEAYSSSHPGLVVEYSPKSLDLDLWSRDSGTEDAWEAIQQKMVQF